MYIHGAVGFNGRFRLNKATERGDAAAEWNRNWLQSNSIGIAESELNLTNASWGKVILKR